jgi:hypothetical protein
MKTLRGLLPTLLAVVFAALPAPAQLELRIAGPPAGGAVRLTVLDSLGVQSVLEGSTDLRNWQPLATNTVPAPSFTLTAAWPHPVGYFRVRRTSGYGWVIFGNRVPEAFIDAPVILPLDPRPGQPLGPGGPLQGPAFLAQLAAAGRVIVDPVPFLTGTNAGYIESRAIRVPTDDGQDGGSATLTMLAWAAEFGASYVEAVQRFAGFHGTSANLTVATGLTEAEAAPMVGLQRFILTMPLGYDWR